MKILQIVASSQRTEMAVNEMFSYVKLVLITKKPIN